MTLMERIRLAALAVQNVGIGLTMKEFTLHDVSVEEAAELWNGGFMPCRFTRANWYGQGNVTWFMLSARIEGVDVKVFTSNRTATPMELEADGLAPAPAPSLLPAPRPVPVSPPSTSHFGWLEID